LLKIFPYISGITDKHKGCILCYRKRRAHFGKCPL